MQKLQSYMNVTEFLSIQCRVQMSPRSALCTSSFAKPASSKGHQKIKGRTGARKEYHHIPSQYIPLRNMSARPPQAPSALKQIWLKWKTLRLPWRRQFLAGSDLSGNTFWEFKDAMNAQRYRRIVKYAKAGHYSDVKVSGKSSNVNNTMRLGLGSRC
jgi:hypothetical protein